MLLWSRWFLIMLSTQLHFWEEFLLPLQLISLIFRNSAQIHFLCCPLYIKFLGRSVEQRDQTLWPCFCTSPNDQIGAAPGYPGFSMGLWGAGERDSLWIVTHSDKFSSIPHGGKVLQFADASKQPLPLNVIAISGGKRNMEASTLYCFCCMEWL